VTSSWDELESLLRDLADFGQALALMSWDQAVSMPPKGGAARARAGATLEAEYHRRLTSPRIGELLADLEGDSKLDEMQTANLRVLKRDYDKATKVPEDLVKAIAEETSIAYQVWIEARPASDFTMFKPHMEKIVSLKKQYADAVGWEKDRYDALMDDFEPSLTAAEVAPLFDQLVQDLVPISEKVFGALGETPPFLSQSYDTATQIEFCQWLVKQLGFDTEGGILEESPHPFTMHVAAGDVRQTTRAQADQLTGSIYAAIHETGHALYDQGLPEKWIGLPAGRAVSLGIHESQSRMWENQVGRSRPFSEWMLPHLKERFTTELGMLTPDEFYRGVNHPERTLIRVEADELTYNLHVVLRFEIELGIYRDELAVDDLPDAWDQKMEKYLGIRPPDHKDGVLQDMHWAIGHHGYFPTYTLGTLNAAAFYKKANEELGDLSDEFRRGETSRLLEWLRENIHKHGYRYEAKELTQKILGHPLSPEPFLDYIKSKYGELYGVSF
jgi:carboxypeptidase Taq